MKFLRNLRFSALIHQRKNLVALLCGGIVLGMLVLAYASVPLYSLFCKVTGYGGTPQTAVTLPKNLSQQGVTRRMVVRFDANVDPHLPWRFKPEQKQMEVSVGDEAQAFYLLRNEGSAPLTGMASFNVTPAAAAIYFTKLECFCFEEQTLAPGQEIRLPVLFYIDPEIDKDPALTYSNAVTLSYTFFPSAPRAASR